MTSQQIKEAAKRLGADIVGIGMSFAKRFVILSLGAYVLICLCAALPKKKTEDSQEV